MRCQIQGHQNIQYVCQSPKCDYLPLCAVCKKKHDPEHNSYMIRYEIAVQKALKNISEQIVKLQQYIEPIQKKKQTIKEVQRQIQQLKDEKRRLVRKIEEQIDRQIRLLEEKNGKSSEDQEKFFDELKKKMQSLEDMKDKTKRQSKVLRTSLTLQIQPYLFYFAKNNPYLTSKDRNNDRNDVNIAHLYVKTSHEMIVSQLQIEKRILNPKLLKKVNNTSPLYYLIDPKYETSRHLHYFIHQETCLELRVYDVERQKWKKIVNRDDQKFSFTKQAYTLQDHQFNRFYVIGGRRYSTPSDQILWYNVIQNTWQKSRINIPRYASMATLVYKKKNKQVMNQKDKQPNYILIAGGIDKEGKAIKSWQLFDPSSRKTEHSGEMNFASSSGRLVNFEGDIVFRIGGLANKSEYELGICPIIQKCDFSALNQPQIEIKQKFKFSYIQMQDICRDKVQLMPKNYQLYYAGQGAIQINANQILVYGGKLANGKQVAETYILNVEKFQMRNFKGQNTCANRYYARWINQKPLISQKNFQNFNPCIWKSKLYSLQNLSRGGDQTYKGLIQFDMKCWYETENIVDDNI